MALSSTQQKSWFHLSLHSLHTRPPLLVAIAQMQIKIRVTPHTSCPSHLNVHSSSRHTWCYVIPSSLFPSTDLVAENVKWMTLEERRRGGQPFSVRFLRCNCPLVFTGWQTLCQFRNRTFKRFATCWVTHKLLHHLLCFFSLHSFTFSHRLPSLCLTSSHLHISQSYFFSCSLSLTLYIALIRIFFSYFFFIYKKRFTTVAVTFFSGI